MKIKLCGTLLMFAILVVGCASPRYVDRKLKDVLPLLAAGKYDVAVSYARYDFNTDDSDAATIRKEFAKYPGAGLAFKSRLRSEFASEADLNRFEAFPKSIELARRDAVISNSDAGELLSDLTKRVDSGNRNGELAFTYSNASIVDQLSGLNAAEHQAIIFDRSLQTIPTSGRGRQKLLEGVIKHAQDSGLGSVADRQLRARVEVFKLSTPEIRQHVLPFDRALGQRLLDVRAIRLVVKSEPSDRLLEEDVRDLLKKNEDITFVTDITIDTTVLTVGKLQYEERPIPDNKQTITYRQYEVNFVGAILLMPRDASYMYDYVTGGHEISAAYLIKIEKNGRITSDKVFRDHVSKTFSSCENARIVNVFGGVQKAEFVANQDMSNRCNGSSSRPSPNNSRSEIMSKVVDEALSQLAN